MSRGSHYGMAVISDLDGTLLELDVDWETLRQSLGVRSIRDVWLWTPERQRPAWEAVAAAEIAAAHLAVAWHEPPAWLMAPRRWALLTNNSSLAAAIAIEKLLANIPPDQVSRPEAIYGREALGGPKQDRECFAEAIGRLLLALEAHTPQEVAYVGNEDYELEFATACGLHAIHV